MEKYRARMALSLVKIALILTLVPLTSEASGVQTCIDQELGNQMLLTFDVRSYDNLKADYCSPKSVTRKLVAALLFLKNLPPLVQANDLFGTGIMKDQPYTYFSKRVATIFIARKSDAYCRLGALAYSGAVGSRIINI